MLVAPEGATLIGIGSAYQVFACLQELGPRLTTLSAAPLGLIPVSSVKPVAYAGRLISTDPPGLPKGGLGLFTCDQLLKPRLGSQRIPFPPILQIVDRDAVVDAVHCAWRMKQPLYQRNRQAVLADTRVDERETTIHNCPVQGVFRFRFQFDCATALPNCFFLSPHKRIAQSKVRVSVGIVRRFYHGFFKLLVMHLRRNPALKQKPSATREFAKF